MHALSNLYKLIRGFQVLSAIGLVLLCALPVNAQNFGPPPTKEEERRETLQKVLNRAMEAIQIADFEAAAEAFNQLESEFGNEKQYLEDNVQRVVLPLAGYAFQMTEDYQAAIEVFERFLENFPSEPLRRSFVTFSLAKVYQLDGNSLKAAAIYGQYAEEFSHRNESYIAQMRQADLLFDAGEPEQALAVLDKFYRSGATLKYRMQARLSSLEHLLKVNEFEKSAEIMLNTSWRVDTMPELAVLAFSAIRTGDYLNSVENYADAIRVYRLVPPRDQLILLQQARTIETESEYAQRIKDLTPTEAVVWKEYYEQLLGSLKGQLKSLEESDDYTPGLLLRYGTAYLQSNRAYEAYTVFEAIAEDETFPKGIRTDGHYRWILSAHQMEDWPEALRIAMAFLERYPDSPLAPNALTLIADAYQQSSQHAEAIDVLTTLLTQYGGHALYPRWLFSRGFNHVMANTFAEARVDFDAFEQQFPKQPLLVNARYWRAQSFFFEKQYAEALAGYDKMLPTIQSHYMLPEVVYQRCSVLYAMRDYDEALVSINDYLTKYQGHERAPEAQVLKGDIQMGKGELLDAINSFRKVTPEAEQLFPYAIFQIGKIYRAYEYYDKLLEHFNEYLDRDDLEEKPRVSEALYWIGWTHTRLDNIEAAFPVFLKAIQQYGNAPDANEVPAILNQLEQLYKKRERLGITADIEATGDMGLLAAEDFSSWASKEREAAFERGELTWYSRLSLYLAMEARDAKDPNRESLIYLELADKVPTTAMGAETLGRVGLALQKLEFPSAEDYFAQLLEEYPKSPHRAMALYGMAAFHQTNGDLDAALKLLTELKQSMPLHEFSIEATMLHADVLAALDQSAEAIDILEDLLRLKSARGRPHAQALFKIGTIHEATGDFKQAIPYYQRVFNLYRAYRDVAAQAYVASAGLFEAIDDLPAALSSYEELLKEEMFAEFPEYAIAQKEAERLRPLVPEEPTQAEATTEEAELP